MLPEVAYAALREGRLPTARPRPRALAALARDLRYRAHRAASSARKVKPLARVKAVVVEGTELSGYRVPYRGAFLCVYGDALKYSATFANQLRVPVSATCRASLEGEERVVTVLFGPRAKYRVEVGWRATEPRVVVGTASATALMGLVKFDSTSDSLPVGLFDDRYKPVGEYPVPGAENAELDIPYRWKVENKVYPEPLPEGVTIGEMSVSFVSGFVKYGGKVYADPDELLTVRLSARMWNRTDKGITAEHWGVMVAVLYDDDRHVSAAALDVRPFERAYMPPRGGTYGYSFEVTLPRWCYGKIAVAHAINLFKDRTYIYGGGPLWQFEAFRVRLP